MHLADEQKCKRVKMILRVDHSLGDCIVVLSPFTTKKKRSVNNARERSTSYSEYIVMETLI